jgi:hypothetical protein
MVSLTEVLSRGEGIFLLEKGFTGEFFDLE